MTLAELPDKYRFFTIHTMGGNHYALSGGEYVTLMNASSQFIRLRSGDIVNKSSIDSIQFDRDMTKAWFKNLPEIQKLEIEKEVNGGLLPIPESIKTTLVKG